MDIVEFTCGNCQQPMSVLREHLGTNVQCPHCESVVETVAPDEQEDERAAHADDGDESIFASEDGASDDLFGEARGPQIEMPSDEQPVAADAPTVAAETHESELEQPDIKDQTAPAQSAADHAPFTDVEAQRHVDEFTTATGEFEDAPQEELVHEQAGASRLVARHRKSGIWGPIALIFLVPYSIVMTGCVVYLLANRQTQNLNHLELLPDPIPNQGGPQRVEANPLPHDLPLSANQKTRINKSIRLGVTAVIAKKIVLTKDGDLEIHMTMRNLSSDLQYNPLPDVFLRPKKRNSGRKPYFFLDAGSIHLYGGYVAYADDGVIGPNETENIVVTTYDHDRDNVKKLMKNKSRPCIWRIHIRRGFYEYRGDEVSTTGVIGVEFRPREIRSRT